MVNGSDKLLGFIKITFKALDKESFLILFKSFLNFIQKFDWVHFRLLFQFLSTPLQAVLCIIVFFSDGTFLNKLFSNYSLWYVFYYPSFK